MKKLYALFLLASTTTAVAQTNYPGGISGCIARWTFQSSGGAFTTVTDASGNGRTGTPMNVSATAGFRNKANAAASFNGTNSYVDVAHNAALSPGQLTVVALVRPFGFYTGTCQGNNIIYKGVTYTDPGVWALAYDDQTFDQNCASFNPNYISQVFVGGSSAVPAPGPYISTNQWYLMVVTYGTDSVRRYQVVMDTANHLNALNPYSVVPSYAPLASNTSDVRIGATRNPPYPYWLNGAVDEIALFNRPLTRAEVQQVYDTLWGFRPNAVAATPRVKLGLLPTANDGLFTASLDIPAAAAIHFDVMDATGRLLHSRKTSATAGVLEEKFDLRGQLASGTYFLRARTAAGQSVQRFQVLQ